MHEVIIMKNYKQFFTRLMQLRAISEGKDLYCKSRTTIRNNETDKREFTMEKFDLSKAINSTSGYSSQYYFLADKRVDYPKKMLIEEVKKVYDGLKEENTISYSHEFLNTNRQNRKLMKTIKENPRLFGSKCGILKVDKKYVTFTLLGNTEDRESIVSPGSPIYLDDKEVSIGLF